TAPPAVEPRHERPAPTQPPIPLVGRQAELSTLLTAADDVAGERGRLIVVNGEEGIGKSRLVEELVWRLDGEPARALTNKRWTVLSGACHASEQSLPYHPFVDALS